MAAITVAELRDCLQQASRGARDLGDGLRAVLREFDVAVAVGAFEDHEGELCVVQDVRDELLNHLCQVRDGVAEVLQASAVVDHALNHWATCARFVVDRSAGPPSRRRRLRSRMHRGGHQGEPLT